MARQVAPVEINTFVGGLVSDAGPLTFPNNGSISEDNMVLNSNGLRNRRLGMDFEDNHVEITTGVTYSDSNTYGHTTYRWDNAGSNVNISLLVVQFGNEIKFFNLSDTILSSEVILTHSFDSTTSENLYSYAVVDGILVVTTGEKEISSFEYDATLNTISVTTNFLKIRDLFGVEDVVDGDDLNDGNNVTIRPTTINDEHKYNLRNQSWADPRRDGNNETDADPISTFFTAASAYPSNSDSVNKTLYADANDTDNRTIDRFFASDLVSNRYGTTHAPVGHYIIDAMERGASRKTAYDQTISENSSITMLTITSLPVDRTEGGPSVVAEFSGRGWYAGFNGELTSGDDKSPRLSSYVMFSKRMDEVSDLVRCYQDGDPTSIDEPELLDTDGGFIRIDGAYGIKALVNLGDALFVVASNGVWSIQGNDRGGFSATGYAVTKITDRGTVGARTVVEVENSLAYWGEDGLYSISKNQFGDWEASSITNNILGEFYGQIDAVDTATAQGYYDGYDKKVRWVYKNPLSSSDEVRELVLDKSLGAFYTNTIYNATGISLPKVTGIFESNPFKVGDVDQDVQVGADLVQVGGVGVVSPVSVVSTAIREIQYVAVTELTTVIKYTFSFYKDGDWMDWVTHDSTGVDAEAFMVTGYLSGGEFQHQKQALFLTAYMKKTEDGFETDVNGDLSPLNQSSVRIQTQWNWTDSANSNRWGRVFQAYRHRRHYLPVDINDTFDDGHTVVVSKNKLRGKGNVLSIKFSTEEGKDFQLWGWSMLFAVNQGI